MSHNYLWDKSGEPDAELQQLEETLGRLRHQRPAPAWPAPVAPINQAAQRKWWPRLAAVAALVCLTLAAGWWLALRQSGGRANPSDVVVVNPDALPSPSPTPGSAVLPATPPQDQPNGEADRGKRVPNLRRQPELAVTTSRQMQRATAERSQPGKRSQTLDPQMREEGERAKAQLMLALHLTQTKLHLARKKVNAHSL
jgi:hypothetical protein